MKKYCHKKLTNFWKTVIFGNIYQFWHHLATLSGTGKTEGQSVLLSHN